MLESEDLYIGHTANYYHGDNIKDDPLFVNDHEGDLHLRDGSPAIDAGSNSAPLLSSLATDIDGDSRIEGERVDIGADEFTGGGVADGGGMPPELDDEGGCEAPGAAGYLSFLLPPASGLAVRRWRRR